MADVDNNRISVENIYKEDGNIHVEITHKYSIGEVLIGFTVGQVIWGILSCLLNQLF